MDSAEERQRLDSLLSYEILDTPPEPQFDDIVKIARIVCDVPIALVSLVDHDRQWFKAKEGLELCETPIGQAVCFHAIKEKEILVIPDLRLDPRTKENSLVTADPFIRFYAGAVLRTADGEALGTLCTIDTKPRPEGLTKDQTFMLTALARQTMLALEARRAFLKQLDTLVDEQQRAKQNEYVRKQQSAVIALGDALRSAKSKDEVIQLAAKTLVETLDASRAGYTTFDHDAGTVRIDHDFASSETQSIKGEYKFDAFSASILRAQGGQVVASGNIHADDSLRSDHANYTAMGARANIIVPMLVDGRLKSTVFIHSATTREWNDRDIEFSRAVADRIYSAVAKIEAEDDQRMLNQELSHRLKNTLAMVQAIASQTLRDSANKDEVTQFTKRVIALSRAHDVLLQDSWIAARIAPLLESVIGAQSELDRFKINGANIMVAPRTALSMSLLMHEMATNAVKYGALSGPDGHVKISWSVEGETSKPVFVLNWEEVGGPPAAEPVKRGFGSRMIKMGLAGTGNAQLDYLPAGLKARFEAPLATIRDS